MKLPINSSPGFTMTEALAVLLIISVLMVPFYRTAAKILRYKETIKEKYVSENSRTFFYFALRNAVMNVRFPFWESCSSAILKGQGEGKFFLPYWNGNEEMKIALTFENGVLELSSPDGKSSLKRCRSFRISPLETSDGRTTGIKVTLEYDTDRIAVLDCPFGAVGTSVFKGTE